LVGFGAHWRDPFWSGRVAPLRFTAVPPSSDLGGVD
jgi:hypothetical protein